MFDVYYVVDRKIYKIRIKKHRGPSKILLATDQDINCITDLIEQYQGPSRDWHGQKYTPRQLGYQTITLELSNGSNVMFKDDDILKID